MRRSLVLCVMCVSTLGCRAVLGIDPVPTQGMSIDPVQGSGGAGQGGHGGAGDGDTGGAAGEAGEPSAASGGQGGDRGAPTSGQGGGQAASIAGHGGAGAGGEPSVGCQSDMDCGTGTQCRQRKCANGSCQTVSAPSTTACGSGSRCDGAGECAKCSAGATRCSEAQPAAREVCDSDGSWKAEPCAHGCLAGRCTDCAAHERECTGTPIGVRECGADGVWGQVMSCPAGHCLNGACTDCEPRTTMCETKTAVKQCDVTGKWLEQSFACVQQACVGGQCQGLCTPAAKRCADVLSVTQCDDQGGWGAAQKCPNACIGDISAGDCGGECVPNTDACVQGQNATRHCNASAIWGPPQSCGTGTCDASGHCTACTPGSSECLSGTQVRTCNDLGSWSAATSCANGCESNRCNPPCVSAQCVSATLIQTCTNGKWDPATPCKVACASGKCLTCAPKSKRCATSAANALETCADNGEWGAPAACPTMMVCTPSLNACTQCAPGDVMCLDNVNFNKCKADGSWTRDDCRPNSQCNKATLPNLCPCLPGFHTDASDQCVKDTPADASVGQSAL